eukprot:CAMPEP_0170587300 /NCGR_PEP_ID=MMETSP0224-20130122/10211_1 /TAXON_ID=285029 /ORGANISM="Togula jolla, Strain CCCM 725" /LENGTH=233 /DNA_ID=CAMNT_0010910917 /DNA_START=15 /DNA_END=716 /DNA_ORIENTATION=-
MASTNNPSSGLEGRYSEEPDLRIIVEGQTVWAHSQILMQASPVFRKLLLTKMEESIHGKVELVDKSKDEFDVFWDVLRYRSCLTKENVKFLSVWAHEYDIEGLHKMCEDYLISSMEVSVAGLEHAIKYNLPDRAAQCLDVISADIREHIEELTLLGSAVSAETMHQLWPFICKAADVDAEMLDDFSPGHVMWPFLAKAVVSVPLAVLAKWSKFLSANSRDVLEDRLKADNFKL